MRTAEQVADDIIRLHTDDPNEFFWQAARKLMIVAMVEYQDELPTASHPQAKAYPRVTPS